MRAGILCSASLLLACPRVGGPSILEAGTGVPLRSDGSPVKETCPEDARRIMRVLKLGKGTPAQIDIDANQIERAPLTIFAGPIESIVTWPVSKLYGGSRLYGWVWTTRRGVVIRYYRAQMPRAEVIPICAEARGPDGDLASKPGKYPGSVEFQSSKAQAFFVEEFP